MKNPKLPYKIGVPIRNPSVGHDIEKWWRNKCVKISIYTMSNVNKIKMKSILSKLFIKMIIYEI